jgi:hypothetical protein
MPCAPAKKCTRRPWKTAWRFCIRAVRCRAFWARRWWPSAELTDLFFLIGSLDDRGHLRTLARLSRLVADADLLAELRAAPDARAVHELIEQAEAKLI